MHWFIQNQKVIESFTDLFKTKSVFNKTSDETIAFLVAF